MMEAMQMDLDLDLGGDDLPIGWQVKPLGKVATLQRGFDLPVQNRIAGNCPIFAANGPVGTHNEYKVKGPGVVTGRSGTLGKVHYVETDYWPLNTSLWVKDFHGNDPKWIARLLRWMRLETHTRGTGVPTLNRNLVHTVPVLLPPLTEQKRIAAILDKADRIRQKRKETIRLTEELLRSAFLEMFGDPVTNPKGWEVQSLGKVARINRGKFTPRPRNDPRFFNGQWPFIQTGDISHANGYLNGYSQTLNELGKEVSRSFKPGAVVIAIVGATIGETAILQNEMYCPDSVIGIEVGDNLCPEYLEYLLRSWKMIFRARAPETARANINLETLRPIPIPLPPIEEQKVFRKIYQFVHSKKNEVGISLSEDLFNALLQRAFKGQL
jgi:type I restriction enzyme, S subunit